MIFVEAWGEHPDVERLVPPEKGEVWRICTAEFLEALERIDAETAREMRAKPRIVEE